MSDEGRHSASIVSITGKDNETLNFLANLYFEPFDPESVRSVVASLSHRPAVRWALRFSQDTWCTAMDETEGGALYVSDMEGRVHVYRAGAWTSLDTSVERGLNAVWAAGDDEAFAVGLHGERVRLRGAEVSLETDPQGTRLNAIHGSSLRHVVAVGDHGAVWKFDGKHWQRVDAPTNVNLLSVLCVSPNEVYLGGADTLFRWAGAEWARYEADGLNISGLAKFRGRLIVACGAGGVHVAEGDGLERMKDLNLYRLRVIDDVLFGVGNRLVAQYDGAGWWGGNLDV